MKEIYDVWYVLGDGRMYGELFEHWWMDMYGIRGMIYTLKSKRVIR